MKGVVTLQILMLALAFVSPISKAEEGRIYSCTAKEFTTRMSDRTFQAYNENIPQTAWYDYGLFSMVIDAGSRSVTIDGMPRVSRRSSAVSISSAFTLVFVGNQGDELFQAHGTVPGVAQGLFIEPSREGGKMDWAKITYSYTFHTQNVGFMLFGDCVISGISAPQ